MGSTDWRLYGILRALIGALKPVPVGQREHLRPQEASIPAGWYWRVYGDGCRR